MQKSSYLFHLIMWKACWHHKIGKTDYIWCNDVVDIYNVIAVKGVGIGKCSPTSPTSLVYIWIFFMFQCKYLSWLVDTFLTKIKIRGHFWIQWYMWLLKSISGFVFDQLVVVNESSFKKWKWSDS